LLKVLSGCAGAPHPLYVNVCKRLTISGLSGHGSVTFTAFVIKLGAELSGESRTTSIQPEIRNNATSGTPSYISPLSLNRYMTYLHVCAADGEMCIPKP